MTHHYILLLWPFRKLDGSIRLSDRDYWRLENLFGYLFVQSCGHRYNDHVQIKKGHKVVLDFRLKPLVTLKLVVDENPNVNRN